MAKTKAIVKTRPEIPTKVDRYEVTVMDLKGWRKREVVAALEAVNMEDWRAHRHAELWETVKPKHVHEETDNEARGLLSQALFLTPYAYNTGEVRHLFDWAGRFMRKRIDDGKTISVPVFHLWHVLGWMLMDWQEYNKSRNGQES